MSGKQFYKMYFIKSLLLDLQRKICIFLNIACDPSIYTKGHSDFIVSNCTGNSIGSKIETDKGNDKMSVISSLNCFGAKILHASMRMLTSIFSECSSPAPQSEI